jgi:hypothetical protein
MEKQQRVILQLGGWAWRKLHNEELRDLYSSPSLIKIVEARRMR